TCQHQRSTDAEDDADKVPWLRQLPSNILRRVRHEPFAECDRLQSCALQLHPICPTGEFLSHDRRWSFGESLIARQIRSLR
ncbi:hypothetical protein PMAYCL1PPCAC_31845, partial [Pristionchus mayeri]